MGFSLQKDASEFIDLEVVRDVAAKAFVAWTDVPCEDGNFATLAFTPMSDVSCHKAEFSAEGPNANIILFQDTKWSYSGAGNTLAKTTVSFDTDTGAILDADIEINHAYNEFTVGDDNVVYDLQAVLTHEIGHFIGIDHSPDPFATMFLAYEPGDTFQRDLGDDDVAALCTVYPTTRDATCNFTPQGGFASRCAAEVLADEEATGCAVAPGQKGALGALWAGVLWMLWGARRRAPSTVASEE